MKPMRTPLLLGLSLAVAFAGPAVAQGAAPSAEQASALEQQLRDALVAVAGSGAAVPARPVQFTPEGDHYLVQIPLAPLLTIEPPDAAFTFRTRNLDGSRWSLEDERLPAAFKLTGTTIMPDPPPEPGAAPGMAHAVPTTYDVTLGQQHGHGLFDPTYATPTGSQSTIDSIGVTSRAGAVAGATYLGKLTTQSSVRPIDPAHVDLLADATTENYSTQTSLPGASSFKLTAQTVHVVTALSNLAHDAVLPLLRQAIQTSRLPPAAQAEQKAGLRQMLASAQALLTGARIEEVATGVHYDFNGHTGSMAKLDLALSGDAPQDMLTTTMSFSLDGLTVDGTPPAIAAYIPSHISLRPTLSNLSAKDLTNMAMDSLTPGSTSVPPGDVEALFSHGGINLGFDSLGLDIAGTQFGGTGKFTLTGPQTITGAAEITAHGLDALIAKAEADPMLAKGIPVVIFLKGIAHTTGDQAVWQISVANQKVLVNGVDLSAMAGAMR